MAIRWKPPDYDWRRFYDNRCDRQGCGRLAGHGFGVSILRGLRGFWFCAVHAREFAASDAARVLRERFLSGRAGMVDPAAAPPRAPETLFEAATMRENRALPTPPAAGTAASSVHKDAAIAAAGGN